MAYYGEVFTPQISTGNVLTTVDLRDTTKPNNGATNPLGAKFRSNVVSAANPNGFPVAYRYVRYNSATNAAVVAFPGVVFWTDATRTTVTSTLSEAYTGTINMIAGYLLPNSASITTLTAAILNGNFVWMQVAGFLAGAASVGSTAVGDALIGANTWLPGRTAAGTAPLNRVLAWAGTAIASSKSDVDIVIESL